MMRLITVTLARVTEPLSLRSRETILILCAFLFSATAALAQGTILQGGPWAPGHAPMYTGQGSGQAVVQDSGPAGGGATGYGLSEQLLVARGTGTPPYVGQGTGPFGTNWCDYDAPITNATGYHFLCFSPNASLGGGVLAFGPGGAASPIPFFLNINGSSYQFPFSSGGVVGPNPSVINNIAIWGNTVGTLLGEAGIDSTLQLSGGNFGIKLSNPNIWSGAQTFGAATVTGSFTATGLVTNNDLANASTTVNGQTCTLGSTCTISVAASLVVGSTTIGSGTPNGLLYDSGGVLGNLATANNGVLVTSSGGVPSVSTTLPSGIAATNMALTTPSLGVASGTSLNLNAGTLAAGTQALLVSSTLTDLTSSTQNGVIISTTSSGTGSPETQRSFRSILNAGYTGSGTMEANSLSTQTQSTANTVIPAAESISFSTNAGAGMGASGATTGANVGGAGHATSGTTNVGLLGLAQVSQNSGQNFGVVGSGYNAGTGTIAAAGGFFTLNGALPTNVSAALIADSGSSSNPIFLGRVNGVTTDTVDLNGGIQIVPAAALVNGEQALSITATQPTTPVAAQNAVAFNITSAGSASQNNGGALYQYLAGYTGPNRTTAISANNQAAGTANVLIPNSGTNTVQSNAGGNYASAAVTTGLNTGISGQAAGGVTNAGVVGVAQVLKNSGTNIGVVGTAVNTGTSPVEIGGWFSLNQTSVPAVSAALIADNANAANPVALFQAGGTTQFQVDKNGQIITSFGTPTISSGACGAGSNGTLGAGSTNQAGLLQIGGSATTTCTVSFSTTLTAAPLACVFSPANAAAAATGTTVAYVSSVTTGHWVLTGSALANANYYYHCI